MGLQGPFPATFTIKDKHTGDLLLEAISDARLKYQGIVSRQLEPDPVFKTAAKEFGELYADVLMACGDD